jgi:hypothetical protein
MKTLSEILLDIQEILATSNLVEIRLQQFKASGFQIEFNWVKNGSIGDVYYMKRKQVYRIQISVSERCGNYDKAYCIVIPVSNVIVSSNEMIKIRNISIARKKGIVMDKSS